MAGRCGAFARHRLRATSYRNHSEPLSRSAGLLSTKSLARERRSRPLTSRMRHLFPTLILTLVLSTNLYSGLVENVAPQTGRSAAPVSWTDETERVHRLSEFAGYPVILLPVYTRCRTACLTNLGQLK